jgi:hypothetical protein
MMPKPKKPPPDTAPSEATACSSLGAHMSGISPPMASILGLTS